MSQPARASQWNPSADLPEEISAARLWVVALVALTLAVAVRLPYLSESFWVDELHSAWTLWGDFGDVSRRARLGNQTPVYYWCLWFWRLLVGDGEVGLRMSSVILSSLASGVVAAGVARHSRSLIGGLTAGGISAIEPNAVFFGTELRVFAAVMFLAAVACWAWIEQQRTADGRSMALLFAAVLLAAIIQPTSLGVLGWLCISSKTGGHLATALRGPLPGQRPAVSRLLVVLVIAVGVLLLAWSVARVLIPAWQHRGQWAAFASADSPWQIWTMWRWNVLLVIPAGLASSFAVVDRVRRKYPCPCPTGLWLRPGLMAIWVTVFFWLVSASGVAAVFHRRYLIAVLPILVWAGAAALGEVCCRIRQSELLRPRGADGASVPFRSAYRFTQPLVLLVMGFLGVLVVFGVNDALPSPRLRGEDWRGAVADVSARADTDAPILLSPGLIETQRLLSGGDPVKIDFLTYPLSGPYALSPLRVIDLADDPTDIAQLVLEGQIRFAVLRSSQKSAQRWAERIIVAGGSAASFSFSIRSYGGVQVVQFLAGEHAG